MQFAVQPILSAAPLETIIGIAVFAVSIIAWIVNMVNEKNQQNPRGQAPKPRPRPHDDRFQNEIDMFLNEVQRKSKPEPDDEVPIEIVPDDELRGRTQPRPAAAGFGSAEGPSLRDRHLESTIGKHLEPSLPAESAGQTSGTAIMGGDLGILGSRAARSRAQPKPKPAAPAGNVVKWLQNPDDVRKAIIVGEILAPCRSLPERR